MIAAPPLDPATAPAPLETLLPAAPPAPPPDRRRWGSLRPGRALESVGLALVLALSAFLNLYRLDTLGHGNTFYAAAVRSMMHKWHAFWYAGFDSGGFLAVDKPPVGLWFQVLSAKLLGFSGVAVLLPQALAGVLAVLVLYRLVRRAHGLAAGLLAGAALAVSPVSVTTQRNNTMDAELVLALLLGAWAVLRAVERGRLRWLLAASALLGVGFEIKMLQAYLALPAVFGVYLLCAPCRLPVRIGHLAAAGALLLVVSFAWPLAVDLTPPGQRPYITSTTDNRELSLIFGANGLQRVLARAAAVPAAPGAQPAAASPTPASGAEATRLAQATQSAGATREALLAQGPAAIAAFQATRAAQAAASGQPSPTPQPTQAAAPAQAAPFGARSLPVGPGGQGGAGPGTANVNGAPGPLRLLNPQLAPLVGWLAPLAALGVAAGLLHGWSLWRRRQRPDRAAASFVLWTVWLGGMGAFFSVAGNFNNYYLITLAPAIAALAGIGVAGAWRATVTGGRVGWLLPLALLATPLVQTSIVAHDPVGSRDWQWLVPLAWAGAILGGLAAVYVLGRGKTTSVPQQERPFTPSPRRLLAPVNLATTAVTAGTVALLVGPAIWAGGPTLFPARSARAAAAAPGTAAPGGAGPQGETAGGGTPAGTPATAQPGGTASSQASLRLLVRYLSANRGGARFMVAAPSALTATPYILATGEPVMAYGGITGRETPISPDGFAARVARGDVRFVIIGASGSPGSGSTVSQWVRATCATVPPAQWAGDVAAAGGQTLYDCATRRSSS